MPWRANAKKDFERTAEKLLNNYDNFHPFGPSGYCDSNNRLFNSRKREYFLVFKLSFFILTQL